MLTLKDIHAGYGKAAALHGISLDVQDREVVALVGPNGAGKTTTLRCITGEVAATQGSVIYDGKNVAGMTVHEIVGLGISCSPEGRNVFGNLTVFENLRMGGFLIKDRALMAGNQVLLNQLTFGKPSGSPDALKLPVLLAVALLKDANGNIDINLPISGSLDDPQFSVGGIIVQVIVNTIAKAVTAPFDAP